MRSRNAPVVKFFHRDHSECPVFRNIDPRTRYLAIFCTFFFYEFRWIFPIYLKYAQNIRWPVNKVLLENVGIRRHAKCALPDEEKPRCLSLIILPSYPAS